METLTKPIPPWTLVAARTQQCKTAIADLERTYDIKLEALVDALVLKEAETAGHSRAVTAVTIAIAHKLGLPKEEINVIARGEIIDMTTFCEVRLPNPVRTERAVGGHKMK